MPLETVASLLTIPDDFSPLSDVRRGEGEARLIAGTVMAGAWLGSGVG